MGAFTFYVSQGGKTASEAFSTAVAESRREYGDDAYAGCIANQDDFILFDVPKGKDPQTYASHLLETDNSVQDKWGPCGAVLLDSPTRYPKKMFTVTAETPAAARQIALERFWECPKGQRPATERRDYRGRMQRTQHKVAAVVVKTVTAARSKPKVPLWDKMQKGDYSLRFHAAFAVEGNMKEPRYNFGEDGSLLNIVGTFDRPTQARDHLNKLVKASRKTVALCEVRPHVGWVGKGRRDKYTGLDLKPSKIGYTLGKYKVTVAYARKPDGHIPGTNVYYFFGWSPS